jgi:protein-disulfide isomerase
MAAQCANDQGRFWDYHNILFKNQKALTDVAVYTQFAQELGLDMAAFNDCMTTQKYADEITTDFKDGQKYGRIGTPTFFVNGKPIIGAQPYEEFARVLDEQLAAAQAAGS